jgi:SWI/SNF-related matrix-associated actin-dependent regulator 1 of chromatin subfamily A
LKHSEEKDLLIQMGNYLDGIDNVIEKNDVGFNRTDKQYWPYNVGNVNKMKKSLKKYKRQLSAHFGEEIYNSIDWASFNFVCLVKNQNNQFQIFHDYSEPMNFEYRNIGAFWNRDLKCRIINKYEKVIQVIEAVKSKHPDWKIELDFDVKKYEERKNNGYVEPDVLVDFNDEINKYTLKTPYSACVNEGIRKQSEILKWEPELKLRSGDSYLQIEAGIKIVEQCEPNWKIEYSSKYDSAKQKEINKLNDRRKVLPELLPHLNSISLFPYQNEGVRFLDQMNGNALLGDEMGLGKTIQVLAYARINNMRIVVICPNALKQNWIDEAHEKFNGFYGAVLNEKTKDNIHEYNIVSINYESAKKYLDEIKNGEFDLLVLDESHKIKNPKAKRTQMVLDLKESFPHVICLSGTAIKNKREELFCQAKMVSNKFDNKYQLIQCTISHLWEQMKDFYIRRTKQSELKDLPEKLRSKIVTEVKFETPETHDIGEFAKLKHHMAKMKVPHTVEFVNELISNNGDGKIIVFTDSEVSAKRIHEELGNIAILHTGKVKQEQKEIVKKEFINNPEKKVFVATTQTAGVGLTLTVANKVVFNDLPWTPADLEQAEDRAHRIGQKKCVNIYNVCSSEWDEYLYYVIIKKMSLAKRILDNKKLTDKEKDIEELSVEALMKKKFMKKGN